MNAVITLNWNTTDLLIGMFESAIKNSFEIFKTIIVDNGSEEKEFDKLKKYFEEKQKEFKEKNSYIDFKEDMYEFRNKQFDVVIKRLPKNLGFSAGNNIALDLIKEKVDLVFFINSDIVVNEKDWDIKFKEIFNSDKTGVVGCAYHPLIWSSDGRFKIQPIVDKPVESESVQGAFFSIPFNLLQKLKADQGCYFDEKFKFAHYEETDLCFRIMNLGYKCFWIPIRHEHLHNKSATKSNGYKLSEEIFDVNSFKSNSEKNRQYLFEKHKDFFMNRVL